MKKFIGTLAVALASSSFCLAATELRRADIYVDEDLYKDADVLAAIQKYADAVEKNFNFTIDIKSFPSALVLDKNSLASGSPVFKSNSTAEELKAVIKESWQDKSKAPLAGAILMGNLPFAQMEYFVRKSDGKAGYPEDSGFLNYQRWVVDLFFMDLDGTWKDEIAGINCPFGGSCERLEYGENGIYDSHYNKAGELGSDDFEIWVSRVNPYGEAREQTESRWKKQLENYDTEYFPKVKELMLRYLDKAYRQQVKTEPRPDKALYSYSSKDATQINDYFVNPLLETYNGVDIIHELNSEKYIKYIQGDYDWVDHMGHGSEKSFDSGVSISDFDTPVTVKARMFDLNSCSIARYLVIDGSFYDRSVGVAHLFRTLEGGVSMIGSTKTSGGYQDNGYFYDLLGSKLLGDAFLDWVNHRTLVFESSKYPKDVYEWFYEFTLFGDPFLTFGADRENLKKDSVPGNIALHALRDFNISGKCYDDAQKGNGRCNVVCGSTEKSYCAGVWGDAEIGSIYARGGIVLSGNQADEITVYNTFENASVGIDAKTQYEYFAYTDSRRWNEDFLAQETLKDFPSRTCEDVSVSDEYALTDGECIQKLTVKSTGTLVIPEGEFFVREVSMEKGSKYKFKNPGLYSALHVEEGFDWNAYPSSSLNDSDREKWAQGFKLYVHGGLEEVDLYGTFYGSVYAPKTMLNVRCEAYGSYFGEGLAVHDVATVWHVPFAPIGGIPDKYKVEPEEPRTFADVAKQSCAMDVQIVAFNRREISFNVPSAGMCKIAVMNALGQNVVAFAVNASAGRNSIRWNSSELSAGRYLVRIQRESVSQSKTLTLK